MKREKSMRRAVTATAAPVVLRAMDTTAAPDLPLLPLSPSKSATDGVAAVFREHGDELVGMLWVFTGDRATAEDLVQEAFTRLYRGWSALADPGRALAYVRTTAFNLARSGFRRHRLAHREAPALALAAVEGRTPDADVVLRDDQRQVVEALRRLPDRQRAALVLRFYADMPESAIAETLGISANSVKTHTRRGLERLERLLEGSQ